jgi:hypothetical protein
MPKHRGNGQSWSTGRLAAHIGMGLKFVRAEIALGHLKATKFGRRGEYRVSFVEVVRYCEAMGWTPPEVPAQEPLQEKPARAS